MALPHHFSQEVPGFGNDTNLTESAARGLLCCTAPRVLANVALDHIFVPLDMVGAPRTQAAVHERKRPLVSMGLVMARMEVEVAICAMLAMHCGPLPSHQGQCIGNGSFFV